MSTRVEHAVPSRLRARHGAVVASAIVAFALGWAASGLARARVAAAPDRPAPATVAGASGSGGECADDAAMRANENLVEELSACHRTSASAERDARDAQTKLAAIAKRRSVPGAVAPEREEWARMAREGRIRLRTPCRSWSAPRRFGRVGGHRRSIVTSSDVEMRERARAAGFEDDELEALAGAYERAHARTWQAIRPACEKGRLFAAAFAESEPGSDADRVAICQASLLPDEDVARAAMRRVAEARAAGADAGATSPEEEVARSLSESVDVLFDEMTRVLGRERATRAIDYGVLCTNETTYDP